MRSPICGRLVAWIPRVDDAAAYLARRARAGRRAARARRRERRCGARADPCAARRGEAPADLASRRPSRFRASRRSERAGLRAGSPGPRRSTSSSRCSAGQPTGARRSRRSGSARTCSSPTTGVDGLVVKLAGELAAVEIEGETARRGRRRHQRRLPASRAGGRARRARVRLGDPGHGRRRCADERRRLRERLALGARRRGRRRPGRDTHARRWTSSTSRIATPGSRPARSWHASATG